MLLTLTALSSTTMRAAVARRFSGHLVRSGCLFLIMAVGGCDDGGADRIRMRKACLNHVFDGYVAYAEQYGVGPADITAFDDFVEQMAASGPVGGSTMIAGQVVSDEALARLREGEIVVIWAGKIPTESDERAECLLAFEAGSAGSGGYVVSADGEVQHVTAAKFSEFRELSP